MSGAAFVLLLAPVLWLLHRSSRSADVLSEWDSLASVGSFFVGAAGLVVAVVALARPGGGEPGPAGGLDDAAEDLAAAQREQWAEEAGLRRLRSPRPLRLVWAPIGRSEQPELSGALSATGPPAAELVTAVLGMPARRLVVVGRAGSGKSTLLLLFTLSVLDMRRPEDPVPVLLSAAGWDPAEPLRTWLGRRLLEDFPFLRNARRYGADVVSRMVGRNRILLVLDGLDEMSGGAPEHAGARAAAALEQIEKSFAFDLPVVLACRRTEYDRASDAAGPLSGTPVVGLTTIEPADAIAFLTGAEVSDGSRWQPVADRLIAEPDGVLASALSTPLLIWLARTVYRSAAGPSPRELVELTGAGDIERHLLDRFLAIVYEPGPPGRHRGWLAELARTATTDIRWWELARSTRPAVLATIIAGTVCAIGAVSGLLAVPLGYPFATAALRALAVAGPIGLVCGLAAARRLQVPQAARDVRQLAGRVLRDAPLAAGVLTALSLLTDPEPYEGFWSYLQYIAGEFMTGLVLGLIVSVFANGLSAAATPRRVAFRRATIRQSLGRGLGLGFLVSLPIGILAGLAFLTSEWNPAAGGMWGVVAVGAFTVLIGLPVGIGRWISAPVPEREALSPLSTLRDDRRALLLTTVLPALPVGGAVAVFTVVGGWSPGVAVVAACWSVLAVAVMVAAGSGSLWIAYTVSRLWRALRGSLPWRLMRFLDDAHQRGVLRQTGPAYQFRHDLLHRHLGGRPHAPQAARPERRSWWRRARTTAATVLAVAVIVADVAVFSVPGIRTAIAARADAEAQAEVEKRWNATVEPYGRLGAFADQLGSTDPDTALRLRIAAYSFDGADSMLAAAVTMHQHPGAVASVTAHFYGGRNGPGGFAAATFSPSPSRLRHFTGATVRQATEPGANEIVAAVPDRRVVGVDFQNVAYVWDFAQSPPAKAVLEQARDEHSVLVDDRGGWALVRGSSGVRLWNIAAWPPRPVPLQLNSGSPDWARIAPAWSPDGRWLAFTEAGGRTVLADLAHREPGTLTFPEPGGQVRFSDTGDRALVTGAGTVWDLTTTPARQKWRLPGGEQLSPDGRWVLAGSDVWELRASGPVRLPLTKGDHPTGFSPDGRWLQLDREGVTQLLRLGRQRAARLTVGPRPYRTAFSTDGRRFVALLADHQGVSWNLADQPRMTRFGPVGDSVTKRLEVSGDGRWALAAAPDGLNDAVWQVDVDSTAPVAFAPSLYDFHLGGDNRTVIAYSLHHVVVWDLEILARDPLPPSELTHDRDAACALVGRGLTEAEWIRFLPDVAYRRTCPR